MEYIIINKNINIGEITVEENLINDFYIINYEEVTINNYKKINWIIDLNNQKYKIEFFSLKEQLEKKLEIQYSNNNFIVFPLELSFFINIKQYSKKTLLLLDISTMNYFNFKYHQIDSHNVNIICPLNAKIQLNNKGKVDYCIDYFTKNIIKEKII